MRLVAFAALLALAVPLSAQRHQLPTLTPAQAISRAATASPKPVRAVFQFRVANAAKSRDGLYLDSEKNFRSPQNLGIAIRGSAMPALTKKYGADLESAFVGKTVKVIGEVRRLSVGKNRSAKVDDSDSLNVSNDRSVQIGKNLAVTAGDEISITVGKASIVMKKDGTISINGKDIAVEGSGKIDMKASGNITQKGQKILHN